MNPDVFTPRLPKPLGVLAVELGETSWQHVVLAAAQEAIRLYRPLVDNDPFRYVSELTIALHTLPIGMNNLKRDDEAVPAAPELMSIYQFLA